MRGFAREDLFTVVLEHFQTDTADYADYVLPATTQLEHWDVHTSYGHTDVLLNQPGHRAAGRGQAQHRRSSASWPRAWASTEPCFADERRDAVPRRPSATRSTSTHCCDARLCHAAAARGAVRRRRLSHALGQVRVFQRSTGAHGLDGLPDHVPNHESARARSTRATRWR